MSFASSCLIVCSLLVVARPAEANSNQTSATDSAFTMEQNGAVSRGCLPRPANDTSIGVAHIEFNDDGTFAKQPQLKIALDCSEGARKQNPNGAVVLLFIHGWHHNAAWDPSTNTGDPHFAEFRRILMSLALREAERYKVGGLPAGRRIVGMYLGWNGDPTSGFYKVIATHVNTHLSFNNRYKVAKRIAAGSAIRETVRRVIETTKSGDGPDSPLMLVGHSMGAMILETALESLIRQELSVAAPPATPNVSCSRVERNGQAIVFPDLVMLLNSAAVRTTSESLMRLLETKQIRKVVACDGMSFQAPIVVAATSEGDTPTRKYLPIATGLPSAANVKALQTHGLTQGAAYARCSPLPIDHQATNYQQSWHCLRTPVISNDRIMDIAIDLPQTNAPKSDCHVRYRLASIPIRQSNPAYWVFQVPVEIVKDHNDVFNGRSNLFLMSLMQMSGAIMSLADKWSDVFEGEQGPCQPTRKP